MTCRKCGELLDERAKFCTACGARVNVYSETTLNPIHRDSDDCAHEGRRKPRRKGKGGMGLMLFVVGFFLLTVLLTVLFPEIFVEIGGYLMLIPMIAIIVFVKTAKRK